MVPVNGPLLKLALSLSSKKPEEIVPLLASNRPKRTPGKDTEMFWSPSSLENRRRRGQRIPETWKDPLLFSEVSAARRGLVGVRRFIDHRPSFVRSA